jgi:hypothetical protein
VVTTALAPSMSARHVGQCSSFHCAAISSTIAVQSVDGMTRREAVRRGHRRIGGINLPIRALPAINSAANLMLAIARDTINRWMLIATPFVNVNAIGHQGVPQTRWASDRLSDAARSLPTCDAAKAADRDSVLHHSPVDGDVRARDRRGPVSGEPCDDFGDFLGS